MSAMIFNMKNICAICGKHTVFGSSQKHRRGVAGKRWMDRVTPTPRVFKPNLQKFEGQVLCAKCIKRKKFDARKAALSI